MATKKSSKSLKSTSSKKDEPVKTAPAPRRILRTRHSQIMPVKQYLMSVGTRATRVEPMAVWAKGQGLSVATVSQWKTLFESY